MGAIRDRPLFTSEFERAEQFQLPLGASYVYAVTSEPRTEFATILRSRAPNVTFVCIREDTTDGSLETDVPGHMKFSTRRRSAVEAFVAALGDGMVHLDITGLSEPPLVCRRLQLPSRMEP